MAEQDAGRPIAAAARPTGRARPPGDLQPQDLTLSLLGTYLLPAPRLCWSGGLVTLLGEFGFSAGASRAALSRLARRGIFARERRGRQVYYALTDRARRLLQEGEDRIFSFGLEPWEDTWTIVLYSLPDADRGNRDRLRTRLAFLGFGPVYDGAWIAPHTRDGAVREVLDDLGVHDEVRVFTGRPSGFVDVAAMIRSAWDWGELDHRYGDFLAAYARHRAPDVRDESDERHALMVRTRIVHDFRRFPLLDPDVPEHLVPGRVRRSEAVALFHDVYDRLAVPAQRHFDRLAPPPES